jgi:N-glycosylase/DNA lyase
MRSRDKATNLKLQETTKTIQKDVSNALKEELLIYEERQLQIIKDIGDIRGDIKVILDRTNNNKQAVYSIKNAPKPTSEIPPQEILNDIQNPE